MTHRFRGILVGAALSAAFCFADAALAAPRIYIRVPPPPIVVETRPVAPGPRHIWRGGYHRWDGSRYVWDPGSWVVAPRGRRAWVSGHWSRHRRGWYWVPGHWRR